MTASVPKNPPPLKPGMDNPWYDYVPFPKRPKLAWPRNARVGWCVLLHLEYWELLPDEKSSSRIRASSASSAASCPTTAPGRSASTATAPASSACSTCSTATRCAPAWR